MFNMKYMYNAHCMCYNYICDDLYSKRDTYENKLKGESDLKLNVS